MKIETKVKIWLTGFIIAATTFLVWSCEAEAQSRPEIACMGTSVTAGYGVTSGLGYCELLGGLNYGVSSMTSTYGVSILDDVIDSKAENVIVEYGLNDAYGNNVPVVTFKRNIKRILRRLKANGMTPILLAAPGSIYTSFNATYAPYVRELKNFGKRGTRFVNGRGEFAERVSEAGQLYYDDLHPNAAGHEFLAELLDEELPE